MKLKSWQKNILSILVIISGGYILFNVAFLLAAIVMNSVNLLIGNVGKPPYLGWIIYLILLTVISWLIFKSKLNDLIKATYLTMPLMVILISEAVFLYEQPQWIVYILGAIIVSGVTFLIYKYKLSWLYYVATAYVTIVALFIAITGVEI
ncbi:MAG: hypothetical protein PHQ32_05835 [Firmicutes bacterium]|nr:hypothetical protein [Bacillota bacterium]